jgi:prepilin-type N-terminal cleavage/methylation domain-containing protein
VKKIISNRRLQRGRTLIELMVAITVATVIILGISAVYSASTHSARSATQMGSMNEDGALSLHLIGQAIKRSGYGEIIGTDFIADNQTLFDFPNVRACKSGTFVDAAAGNFDCTTVPNSPDSLAVQFQGDSIASAAQRRTRNCVGGNPVATQITNTSHPGYLTDVPLVVNVYGISAGTLACSGNGSPFQAMAGNVEEFKVYFGYDEQAADDSIVGKAAMAPGASTIVDADFIRVKEASFVGRENSAWDFVVSVHLCAVAKTREGGTSVQNTGTYEGCPTTASEALGNGPTKTATDRAIRKQYRQVFTIRSQATQSPAIRVTP